MQQVPRYFKLSLDGKPFKVIATDGGLLEYARTETELLITPGERFDIVVGPFEEGEDFSINSLPYNRVTMLKAKLQNICHGTGNGKKTNPLLHYRKNLPK